MMRTCNVFVVKDSNGKVCTWLRDETLAKFAAQEINGTIKTGVAVYDSNDLQNDSFLVSKDASFGIQLNTHERDWREKFDEYQQKVRVAAMDKVLASGALTEEEINLFLPADKG